MSGIEKLKFLEEELAAAINDFNRRRESYRNSGFVLRITTVLFSATITVLLGLKNFQQWSDEIANVALILSALITVFSAIDAFYNFRALWIQKQVAVTRLKELRREISFYKKGIEEGDIKTVEIEKFMNRFNSILRRDLRQWLNMHEEVSSQNEIFSRQSESVSELSNPPG